MLFQLKLLFFLRAEQIQLNGPLFQYYVHLIFQVVLFTRKTYPNSSKMSRFRAEMSILGSKMSDFGSKCLNLGRNVWIRVEIVSILGENV